MKTYTAPNPLPPISDTFLWDLARTLANERWRKTIQNPATELFLFYRLATPSERMSRPIVTTVPPDTRYREGLRFLTGWTTDFATRRIYEALRTAPILGSGSEMPNLSL